MSITRNLVLSAYTSLTTPYRSLRAASAQRQGKAPVMVLFYHRVADHTPNDWTIGTAAFKRQITWVKEHFDVVSLHEAQQRIAVGRNDRAAVSISFDDGYADNCRFALPWLLERDIPFTYFVTLGNVVERRPFPHDVERGQPLTPNSLQEIKSLAAAGVEIGAHTRTHADMGRCSGDEMWDEIVAAGEELAALIQQPVRYFAFPFGQHINMTPQAFDTARRGGYFGVCSAYGGYNFPGDDPFHLQRIHADPEFPRLKNWLTVDPRKIRRTKRFEYL